MNRLLVSVVPFLGAAQSDDAEAVVLLQKHAIKEHTHHAQFPGMLEEVPAERVPAVSGYSQADKTAFQGTQPCMLGMTVGSSVEECTLHCDAEPNCGGFGIPSDMLLAPLGTPVQYACYYGCMDGEPSESRGTYAYYKTVRTTTTTTSSTLYIWKPSYHCSAPWTEDSVRWCCANEANFPEKEKYCPDPDTTTVAPATTAAPETTVAPEPAAVDDPHITSIKGDKFDVYKPGDHEFLVIPEGASPQHADLHISGKVKKFGERENDLWIRKLKVQGKWVRDGPYQLKTTDAPFGKKKSALIRIGASKKWTALDKVTLNGNLHVVSAVDTKAPDADFAKSVSKKLELKAGPVKVLVDYSTSKKSGKDVNHLDLHLKGLKSNHAKSMGGLLAGDIAALQLKK